MSSSQSLSSRIGLLALLLFTVLVASLSETTFESQDLNARRLGFKKRNLETITKIYNTTVYPNNLPFIAKGPASVPPGLFNENATGRITPLGNFTGFNDSTEYFFALAPVPQPPSYAIFSKAQIVSFQSECAQFAASVVYFTQSVLNPNATNNGQFVGNLKQVAFWEFDSEGAVLKYDAWIPNLALYTAISQQTGNFTAAELQSANIQSLCGAVQNECKGSNTQYTSTANCIEVLSTKVFGNWDEVWQDSVICRNLHVLLARVDPKAHCPHVGPTGGGKCVNESYEAGYFQSDQELFGRPEGHNFFCPSLVQD